MTSQSFHIRWTGQFHHLFNKHCSSYHSNPLHCTSISLLKAAHSWAPRFISLPVNNYRGPFPIDYSIIKVHQFICIVHFCHTCSLCRVELVVQFPREGRGRGGGVKSRMCPPYPQRDRKRRLIGAVCRNHRIKRGGPVSVLWRAC